MSSLARLTLYENLFIGHKKSLRCPLKGVRIKRVEFKETVRVFLPQGQRKLSVIMRRPY